MFEKYAEVGNSVKNTAAYIMLGITLDGKKEIIGIWIGENETSEYWLTLLNELKNRGVEDVLIFAIDGLNGFNQAIQSVYPKAEIQRCIVHQIAKNGWTWPPITEILGQIKRFYLDTKNGKYLDTFLDKPLNQFYLS